MVRKVKGKSGKNEMVRKVKGKSGKN